MRAVRRKGLFSYYEAYAAEIFGHRKRGVGRGARGVRIVPFFTAGSRPRPTGEPQMYHYGGSGTPESTVENRKNRWKNSLSRRFSRFFRFDFSFGGLGGVQPQSRAPRLGMRGFLPAGLCPAIAPTEYSAMQKPTRSVGSDIHGPGTGAIRRGTLCPLGKAAPRGRANLPVRRHLPLYI